MKEQNKSTTTLLIIVSIYYLNIIILLLIYSFYKFNCKNSIKCGNIAHGCGLYYSHKYTNSLEAFHNSYLNGYRKIEIDLSVINENHIVGAHDWNLFKRITHFRFNDTLNFTYIVKSKILNNYHIIYDNMIYGLLNKYKDVIIVTDKIRDYKLLKYYSKIINRLYVEVPNYQNLYIAKKLGFNYVLLSISTSNDLENLFSFLSLGNILFGIVIGPNLFYSYKSKLYLLFKRNINIYVWNINNNTDIKLALCKYVSGFYID